MADAATLLALADRCEREKPSRKLDVAIFTTIGLRPDQERHCADWCRMNGRTDLTREHYIEAWAPCFTISRDAAAALQPARWYVIEIRHLSPRNFYCVLGNMDREEAQVIGEANTEPMARGAAALRARVFVAEPPTSVSF